MGVSHQPALMGSCLFFRRVCPVHLVEFFFIISFYQFILCWQDVNILQLKYLHNRSYTKNSMLIKVNKLKRIWNNVKERKSYNNVMKQISG